jgi:hypothetical protein
MRFRNEFAAIVGGALLGTAAIGAEQALNARGHHGMANAALAIMFGSASAAGCGLGSLLTADVRRPAAPPRRRR